MIESNYCKSFFLKTPKRKTNKTRYIYLRVSVNGLPKEKSTNRKLEMHRWDQEKERAIGTKEDARSINQFLDAMDNKITQCKTEFFNNDQQPTAQLIIDTVFGLIAPRIKVLEEFQVHNDEMRELIGKGYSKGTYERFVTARSHVKEFMLFKYQKQDIEFRDLNFEFIKDYYFYLRTQRNCSHNTTLKYISNFKK